MSKSTQAKGDKQKRQKVIITVAVIATVIIVAALVAVIIVLLNREPVLIEGPGIGGYERSTGGRGFVVTEGNVVEVRAALAERNREDARFEFSKTTNWRFETSLTPSRNAVVRNVANNSRTVFFDVSIEEFGIVYVSPYMPLGSEHRSFALDVELPAGTYPAVVTYFLVDDDFNILTDVSVGVTIIIEN